MELRSSENKTAQNNCATVVNLTQKENVYGPVVKVPLR